MALPAVKRELLVRYLDTWAPSALHGVRPATYVDGYAGLDPPDDSCAVAAARVFGEFADLLTGRGLNMLLVGPDASGLQRLDERLARVRAEFGDPPGLVVRTGTGGVSQALSGTRTGARGPVFTYLDRSGTTLPDFEEVTAVCSGRPGELLMVLDSAALTGLARSAGPDGHPQAREHPPGDRSPGDRFFGDDGWRAVATVPPAQRYPALVDRYRDRLRQAGFSARVHVELVENGGAAELLVFATASAKNLERFKDALWAVDEYAGVRYRDPRDAEHELLDISLPPHLGPLRRALLDRVRRTGGCTAAELREYAVAETVYRSADANRGLTALLAGGGVTREPAKGRMTPETVLRPAPAGREVPGESRKIPD